MTAPALVQAVTAASAAASPTSITPTFASTGAGNFLLIAVCVTGTTPSITPPAGWNVLRNTVNNAVANALFSLPNNAGGITAVAITVGGTGGGAAAAAFEFSGMLASSVLEQFNASPFASTNAPASTPLQAPPETDELVFACCYFAAATVNSNTNTADMPNSVGNAVSTSGVPNAQVACFWGRSVLSVLSAMTLALSASVAAIALTGRFFAKDSGGPIPLTNIAGVSGVYVGGFNQGMTGG